MMLLASFSPRSRFTRLGDYATTKFDFQRDFLATMAVGDRQVTYLLGCITAAMAFQPTGHLGCFLKRDEATVQSGYSKYNDIGYYGSVADR